MASINAGLQSLERSLNRIGLFKKKRVGGRKKKEKEGLFRMLLTEYHRLGGLEQQAFTSQGSRSNAGRFGV